MSKLKPLSHDAVHLLMDLTEYPRRKTRISFHAATPNGRASQLLVTRRLAERLSVKCSDGRTFYEVKPTDFGKLVAGHMRAAVQAMDAVKFQ